MQVSDLEIVLQRGADEPLEGVQVEHHVRETYLVRMQTQQHLRDLRRALHAHHALHENVNHHTDDVLLLLGRRCRLILQLGQELIQMQSVRHGDAHLSLEALLHFLGGVLCLVHNAALQLEVEFLTKLGEANRASDSGLCQKLFKRAQIFDLDLFNQLSVQLEQLFENGVVASMRRISTLERNMSLALLFVQII